MAEIYMSKAKLHKNVHHLGTEDSAVQLDFINKAIDIYEFSLGFDHPETGEAYARMGLAC